MQVRPESPTVRPPAVAGLFYPADPARLRAEVSALLAEAERTSLSRLSRSQSAPGAGADVVGNGGGVVSGLFNEP